MLREALALWRGEAYEEFADEDWARPEAQRLGELRLVAYESLFDAELACGRAAESIPELEALARAHETREAFRAQLMVALYRCGRQADALEVYQDYRRFLVDELGLDPTPTLEDLERRILSHDPSLQLAQPAGQPLRGYRLGERLGTGRDGTVYAASLPGVDRDLALRVVHESIADRPEFVRSFEAKAHRLAAVRHPAIVRLQDYWREPGAAYLVMRRMHGGTLADRLARRPMSEAEVATLVDRIGGALVAAEEAGISHGRVSAANVLLDEVGEACLADFPLTPPDPGDDRSSDVQDLAALVTECLGAQADGVREALDRAEVDGGGLPMAEFVSLVVGALTGVSPRADAPPPNPYKGLRAFDETDALDFFGRADLVEKMLGRLAGTDAGHRLLLLVGGSGTGKSSVVRAGLLPRVRRGDIAGSDAWFITSMLPGSAPFEALAEGLRQVAVGESDGLAADLADDAASIDRVIRRLVPDGGQMLLVVDQFEELFTSVSEREQRRFLDGLLCAVTAPDSRLRVVATLRADFYDRPLGVPGFGSAVDGATVTIAAMAPADLEEAIIEPAQRVGRAVEPAVMAELVSAVAEEPSALPALQFTLYELAEACPDTLTLAAYRELGEVDGAIAGRAESLYRSLEDNERTAVRHLFERLVVVGPDGEPTRRRARRAELIGSPADPTVDATVERWAEARLLGLDCDALTREPTVEVVHEALLREWPRLRTWIEEGRDALLVLAHLREAAASWVDLDRDPGALYRGARLQVVLDLTEGRPGHPTESEQAFLAASRQAQDREEREAAEAADRQVRANRRLRLQLGIIAVALVIALIGGLVAFDQRGEAEQERRVATARELAAASEASLDDDPERSILLALAALDATGEDEAIPDAVSALHAAVASSRLVLSVPELGGALDWSPDGTLFVTEGPEESGLVDIRDAATGESVRSFPGHDIDVNDVAFSADGSMLATTGDDGALRVWDPTTGDQVAAFEFDDGGVVWGPSFSADGASVAASWLDQQVVRVFDVESSGLLSEVSAPGAVDTAFRPDGTQLAIGNIDEARAQVVEPESGEVLFTLGGDEAWIRAVAYSPDGESLATTGGDGTTRIWAAADGSPQLTLSEHVGDVNAVDWSADGSRLATVGDDGSARVTEIMDGVAREVLALSARDTRNGLQGVAFSPDGSTIMTSDWAMAAVKVWDVSPQGGAEWLNVESIPGDPGDLAPAFTADSEGLIVVGEGGTATIWDVATGRPGHDIGPGGPGDVDFERVALTEAGDVLATSGDQVPVRLWDVASGELRLTVDPAEPEAFVTGMGWSHDGRLLAIAQAGEGGGWVDVVDLSGERVAHLEEEPDVYIRTVGFGPDDRVLVTTRDSARDDPDQRGIRLWDWEQGVVETTLDSPAYRAALDPTGGRLAATLDLEGDAEVWDAATRRRLATLTGSASLNDIAMSADGTQVATAGDDGAVRLWDVDTGTQELRLQGQGTAVHGVSFSPDGSRLASIGSDGVVRVWALDLEHLVGIATDRITRVLSDDECRQYLHVERCP